MLTDVLSPAFSISGQAWKHLKDQVTDLQKNLTTNIRQTYEHSAWSESSAGIPGARK